MLETKEVFSRDHTVQSYVIEPSQQIAIYGSLMFLGDGLVLAGYAFIVWGSFMGIWLIVIALFSFGYGWNGKIAMMQLLELYEPIVLTETIQPLTEQPAELVQAAVTSQDGATVRLGKYRLTRQQWAELGTAIFEHDNKLVRDIIPGGIFQNLTSRWGSGEIQKEFKRMGMLDETNHLTPEGVTHFAQFAPLPRLEVRK